MLRLPLILQINLDEYFKLPSLNEPDMFAFLPLFAENLTPLHFDVGEVAAQLCQKEVR